MTSTHIYPYVYSITRKVTGEVYYGSRFSNVKSGRRAVDDLGICYFSSSKIVKSRIEELGVDEFEFSVLLEYDDYDVCFTYENLLIKQSRDNHLSLNKWFCCPDSNHKVFYKDTDETRLKKSASKKGKPSNATGWVQTKAHIDKANISRELDRQTWSDEKRVNKRRAISQALLGKPKTYETSFSRKMLCRISDRKEMSRATSCLCFPELKSLFP